MDGMVHDTSVLMCLIYFFSLLNRAIATGLILRKFCVWCLCVWFRFVWICVGTDLVDFWEFLVWWLVCRINPNIMLCSWLGSKYQLTVPWPIWSSGRTWGTIQQRSSSSLFCRRPLWALLAQGTRPTTGCWARSRAENLKDSGMSHAMTASPNLSFRAAWRLVMPLSAEEMLNWQHQRVDVPAHARTAHDGLRHRRLKKISVELSLMSLQWQSQLRDLLAVQFQNQYGMCAVCGVRC